MIPCPRCGGRCAHLLLAGRHDRVVEVEHCGACRLVWFDQLESVQLAGLGWVSLLSTLQQGAGLALPAGKAGELACPRCSAALKTVHNRSRYGRFAALECPRGHGYLHSHAGLLAERGLVRGLLPAERQALQTRRRGWDCLNCGAPLSGDGDACGHCASPLLVMDLPRLAQALSVSPHEDSPRPDGLPLAWHCAACGTALDAARQIECPACSQTVVAPSLAALQPVLSEAGAQLADAATERLLKAARHREQRLERPPRLRDWRDTQFARLQRFARQDEPRPPINGALALALLFLVLLLVWLIGR